MILARGNTIRSSQRLGVTAVMALAAAGLPGTLSAQEILRDYKVAAMVTDDGGAASTGGGDAAALAQKLSNPIASLTLVPFQNNFDFGAGPNGDGFQYKMNFQPVVPISLNEDWNLIWRTIIPFISQDDIAGTKANPSGSQTGLGDTLMTAFFSPKEPTSGGLIWGVGPALSIPTGTDDLLGSEQWAAGPSVVALKQNGGWTYGVLANHLWSFAGDDDRADVSNTFIQPFVAYNTPTGMTYGLNTESSYNWETEEWTVPINLQISKLVKFGDQPVQFQFGGRWYADAPDDGPDWGLRLGVTFMFP